MPPDTPAAVPAPFDNQRLQMWFELFRDLALIELALAGGVITLLGSVFADVPRRPSAFLAIVFLALAAVCAMAAQSHVVDLMDKQRGPDKVLIWLRAASYTLLGAGAGGFMMFALRALGLYGGR